MIVTLPSDVAAYTAWASACYAGTGSCSLTAGADFPDNTAIFTWGAAGESTNPVRTIYFEEGTPGGSYEVYAPITEAFTVTSFLLAPDTTTNIGAEYGGTRFLYYPEVGDPYEIPLTPGMPAFARGAAAVWENQNNDAFEYRIGEQLFQLEIARAATPYTWVHVFDTLEGFQDNARRIIGGDPNRTFLTGVGADPPESAHLTQFVETNTLVPAGGSLTINPGDSLRVTFYRSDIDDMSPDNPHFVFGPLSFVFDTPEAEFWTNFNRTTEQAE